ncbi:hypothetical protein [Exiguobacterium algae]|uniref:hypothetical protein n=1 Tax=Exiguobacterium algae TaxID=2751250 RepID=UPI001BEB2513|nr:hypothetical protein [Exiguobacterium algae]
MKRIFGKLIEYGCAALLFMGLFFVMRYVVGQTADEVRGAYILLFGTAILVFPLSLLGGYFITRPIQRRLNGKTKKSGSGHALQGYEKPHGVTEDRSSFQDMS